MAIIRCRHCQLPMTEEEARSVVCPVCGTTLQPGTPAPTNAPTSSSPPPSRVLRWAVGGTLGACLLLAGILLYLHLPESAGDGPTANPAIPVSAKATGNEAASNKELRAEAKPEPTPKSPAAKATAKDTNKTSPKQQGKTTEPGQTDPKPVEPKKEDVKVVVPNPEGPRPADPKIIPAAAIQVQGFAAVPLLDNNAITIDGDLSDWKDIPSVLLTAVERGNAPKKAVVVPKTQKAYLAYCPKGLLVAVEVVDTSGELEDRPRPPTGTWPFWFNDAVEICIDTLNVRPEERGDSSVHQFLAFPFGTRTDQGIGGYESRMLRNKAGRLDWTIVPYPNTGDNALLSAGRKTPTGWALEVLLPKSALRQGELKPGNAFGFELQIDTGTNVYYFWACDNRHAKVSTHPNLWGEITLAGADARLELLDADKKPTRSFVPGKPLTIRVTDADLNLDPAKKAKVSVSLRSPSGDLKTLPLEESERDPGVFVGTIATRVSTGKREEKVFEVMDGENITVEYVDALNSKGDRNVPVRASFTAGTAPRR